MKHKLKFKVGQVVAVVKSENSVPWYGRVERLTIDGEYDVLFPNNEAVIYAKNELRPLTNRERASHEAQTTKG